MADKKSSFREDVETIRNSKSQGAAQQRSRAAEPVTTGANPQQNQKAVHKLSQSTLESTNQQGNKDQQPQQPQQAQQGQQPQQPQQAQQGQQPQQPQQGNNANGEPQRAGRTSSDQRAQVQGGGSGGRSNMGQDKTDNVADKARDAAHAVKLKAKELAHKASEKFEELTSNDSKSSSKSKSSNQSRPVGNNKPSRSPMPSKK